MVKDSGVAVRPDSVAVEFDDERLVANAGLMLTSTLIDRLGLERLVDQTVDLRRRPGAAKPGRKVCSLVHAMALGADSIDDCDLLRAGGTEALLGCRVPVAPMTRCRFAPAGRCGTGLGRSGSAYRRVGRRGRRRERRRCRDRSAPGSGADTFGHFRLLSLPV